MVGSVAAVSQLVPSELPFQLVSGCIYSLSVVQCRLLHFRLFVHL